MPAVSVAFAVRLWTPSSSAAVVKLQAPAPSAVGVPSTVTPSEIVTVLLASARAGQRHRVVAGDVVAGPRTPLSVVIVVLITGAAGAAVSMVTLSAVEAHRYCRPCRSPSPSGYGRHRAAPRWCNSRLRCHRRRGAEQRGAVKDRTVLLASAVPVSDTVLSLVMWSLDRGASIGRLIVALITGAAGAAVSMVN